MSRRKDPEGSFCVEPYLANLERVTQVGDYTWNWLDYIEAGPYLNAVRYPRINCNVESDPRVVKMAFADGLYINAMPKQPDAGNGTKTDRRRAGVGRRAASSGRPAPQVPAVFCRRAISWASRCSAGRSADSCAARRMAKSAAHCSAGRSSTPNYSCAAINLATNCWSSCSTTATWPVQ